MEKYKLVGIKKHKSKSGNEYFLAYLLLENETTFDIIRVIINNKQVEPLLQAMSDNSFDISQYLVTVYNSYQKQYQLTINYGL